MGIPLVALSSQQPQQPDIGANVQRLLALKSMMQGQQLQQQQLQLEQQKVQDQKTVMGYMQENPGSTFSAAADALKGKISLPAYTTLIDTDASIRQKHGAATQVDLDNFQKVHDQQQKVYSNVAGLSDEDLAKQWPAISQQFNSIPGNNAKVDPNQPLTQQQLKDHGVALGLQEAYLKQEADKRKESAETIEAQNKGEEAAQGAAVSKQKALWYQQHPQVGAPGVPAEDVSAADWLSKPENKGKTFSDYTIAMKKVVPAYNFNLQNNSGAGKPSADVAKQFGMTPEAFDQAAEKYYQTGTMPSLGRGTSGPALQKAIMNRTGELHPGAVLAEQSAEFAANKDSLKKLQGNLDSVSAFESTALKNLQLFRTQAQKVIDTGIPLLNAPLRSAAKMLGSQDQAGFETSLQVANNEIAKVTSSPGLSGVLSDSARKEVENYNPKNATIGQAMHVADILEQDMANRHKSYQDQINDIKGRMGGKMGGNASQPPSGSKFSVTAPNGKNYSFPDQASLDAFKQKAGIN